MESATRRRILSITKDGFLFGVTNQYCMVVSARYTSETAKSGTAYMVKVTADCSPVGPWKPKPMTFEFERYKGNLYVK